MQFDYSKTFVQLSPVDTASIKFIGLQEHFQTGSVNFISKMTFHYGVIPSYIYLSYKFYDFQIFNFESSPTVAIKSFIIPIPLHHDISLTQSS